MRTVVVSVQTGPATVSVLTRFVTKRVVEVISSVTIKGSSAGGFSSGTGQAPYRHPVVLVALVPVGLPGPSSPTTMASDAQQIPNASTRNSTKCEEKGVCMICRDNGREAAVNTPSQLP